MGATPEVNDDSQDELTAALDASKNPGKVVDPEPEPEPEPEKKEEPKAEDKPAAPDDKKPEEKDELFDVYEQNRELRQILRQQKREMSVLNSKLQRLEKRSVAATKQVEQEIEDEEALFGKKAPAPTKKEEPEELTPVEQVQQELAAIARVKGPVLETLLETMEMNPKFEDVREVCSQANFDDIFEAIGENIAAKEGKDASIAALEAEAAVWKMPNPYKYMYGLIKQYHPKYAARQPKKEDAALPEKGKPKEPAKAPTSLANIPGKGTPENAWTAARIDEMDEMELNKVPAEIYEKYLRGELD